MKFGKRFLAAQGSLKDEYLDYKAAKKCINACVVSGDHEGHDFWQLLAAELKKVSKYYNAREAQLKDALDEIEKQPISSVRGPLHTLVQDAADLLQFAALNYVAVVKAVKKRNKRLSESFPGRAKPITAFSVLACQDFFTSKVLTQVTVTASLLVKKVEGTFFERSAIVEDFTCPICLSLLQAPVVLTCTHTFCWGCITTYCLQVLRNEGIARALLSGERGSDADKASGEALEADAIKDWHDVWSAVLEDQQCHEFACPVCRKQQMLDLNGLAVNQELSAAVEQVATWRGVDSDASDASDAVSDADVRSLSLCRTASASDLSQEWHTARVDSAPDVAPCADATETQAEPARPAPSPLVTADAQEPRADAPAPLLPPQAARYRGKLTVVLDLDGTLIASFPPRRAPCVDAHMRTHHVGIGSSLNPQGVFVVERPGLSEFLERAARIGELVIFTAGLAEYAMPIVEAIDPDRRWFEDRVICRDGTSAAREYPCVKDLSRLDRPDSRTLIVDDTPLAFLWHPTQGVPVLGFGGDPSDTLLLDAVLPLLELASASLDVRPFLDRRFGMAAWFASHCYVTQRPRDGATAAASRCEDTRAPQVGSTDSSTQKHPTDSTGARPAAASPEAMGAVAASIALRSTAANVSRGGPMILCDFDKTLIDFDLAERVTESLAPELLPMLVAVQSPANFVPVYNAVFEELRNRGVSSDDILDTLRSLGRSEMPAAIVDALRSVAAREDAVVRVLSNANDVFINTMLEGAAAAGYVHDVISNSATFVRAGSDARRDLLESSDASSRSHARSPATHKLVVSPVHSHTQPHACSLCPESLCKGMHVKALLPYHSRILFACDGANDLCAVLCLRASDVAFVRRGFRCHDLLRERRHEDALQPACAVRLWGSHDELAQGIASFTSHAGRQ